MQVAMVMTEPDLSNVCQSQRHCTLMPLMSSCHETGRQEREEGESSSLSTVMMFLPTELLWNPSIRTLLTTPQSGHS